LRQKITMCPSFSVNIPTKVQSVISDFYAKYNAISLILDENPCILDAFHADLCTYGSSSGRDAFYSSEQILRMFIIKTIEELDWRGLVIRVTESDFLRNFACIGIGKVMTFSFLCNASKLIKPETWEKINALLLNYAKENGSVTSESLRVDSTVVESNIHYPTDTSLLWDCYRVGSRLLGRYRDKDLRCPRYRFHPKKVKKLYTFIATHIGKKTKSTERKVKSSRKELLEKVSELNCKIQQVIEESKKLNMSIEQELMIRELEELILKTCKVEDQSRRALNGEVVPAKERIFSIFEEHTELLKRGKANKPIEFGHMVTIAQTKEKFISYYHVDAVSPHDSAMTDVVINAHKDIFGTYPEKFTADKNYYKGMDEIRLWEQEIDCFSVGKKGKRSSDEEAREHDESFMNLQKFRAGCEGSISVLKRGFGMKRLLSRGFKSFKSWIGAIIFSHNLVKLAVP